MAHINTHTAPGALSGAASAETSLLGRIWHAVAGVAEYRRLHRAERELHALDDRMLADIGVARTEIHQRVWGGRVQG